MNINTSFPFYMKLVIVINTIVLASLCLFCPYSQMRRKMSCREEVWKSGTDGVACPSGLSFAACINIFFGNHELRVCHKNDCRSAMPCMFCVCQLICFSSAYTNMSVSAKGHGFQLTTQRLETNTHPPSIPTFH